MKDLKKLVELISTQKTSFFVSDEKEQISFSDLGLYAIKKAYLLNEQFGKNHRFLIYAHNSVSFAKELLSIIYSENLPLVVNPHYSEKKIQQLIEKFKVNFVVNNNELKIINAEQSEKVFLGACIGIFTSGSTGDEKAVILKNEALLANVKAVIETMNLHEPENVGVLLPMYHSFALVTQFFTTLLTGGKIFFNNNSFAGNISTFITNNQINSLAGVPTTFKTLLLGQDEIFNNVKHITVAGASLDPIFAKQIKTFFPNSQLWVGYGLTEAGPRVTAIEYDDPNFEKGSVGKAITGVEIKTSKIGEILVKSDSNMNFYLDDETATKTKLINDFLHSGDLGKVDSEGYLYVIGRSDDVFMSGGEKISPLLIERILNTHEKVEHAYIYGENDDFLGKKIVAVVKFKSEIASAKELYQHCLKHLERFFVPKIFYQVANFPMTHNGKIKRKDLEWWEKKKL